MHLCLTNPAARSLLHHRLWLPVAPGRGDGRPRVLLVTDSLDVGGAERHVVGLGAALVGRGWSVTIACSVEGALASVARRAGVEVRPMLGCLAKRRVSLAYAWRIARLVHAVGFDVVHAHMYASAAASALALARSPAPLVLTEHSEATWRTGRARWCARHVYRRAAQVIAVSDSIRHRLIAEDGLPADRVTTIHNALLPLPNAQPAVALPPAPAAHTGPVVGVIARLQREKGVCHFVEAAAHVARQVPGARFVIVGDGPLRDQLSGLAQRLGVRDRVDFLGFRLDAPALMPLLDVLVVPSLSEGTPLVILEAMLAGVPVVASAVGGIPEQIRHGREGLLVAAGDARALAQAILALLERPAYAHQLGDAGRQRSAACFSPELLVRRTEDVYRAALDLPTRAKAVDVRPVSPPAP